MEIVVWPRLSFHKEKEKKMYLKQGVKKVTNERERERERELLLVVLLWKSNLHIC